MSYRFRWNKKFRGLKLYSSDFDDTISDDRDKSLSHFRLSLYAKKDRNQGGDASKGSSGESSGNKSNKPQADEPKSNQPQAKQSGAKQDKAPQSEAQPSDSDSDEEPDAKQEPKKPASIKEEVKNLIGVGPKQYKYDCTAVNTPIPSTDLPVLKYGFSNPDYDCEVKEAIVCPVETYFGLVLYANFILALDYIVQTMLETFKSYFSSKLSTYLNQYINSQKRNQKVDKEKKKQQDNTNQGGANQGGATNNAGEGSGAQSSANQGNANQGTANSGQSTQSKKRLSLYASYWRVRKLKLYADEESDEENKKKKEGEIAQNQEGGNSPKKNEGNVKEDEASGDSSEEDNPKQNNKTNAKNSDDERRKNKDNDKNDGGGESASEASDEATEKESGETNEEASEQASEEEDEAKPKVGKQNAKNSEEQSQLDPEIGNFIEKLFRHINNNIIQQFFYQRMLPTFKGHDNMQNMTFEAVQAFFDYVKKNNYLIDTPQIKENEAIIRVGVRMEPIINKIVKTLVNAFNKSLEELGEEVAKVKKTAQSGNSFPEMVFQIVNDNSGYDINEFINSLTNYVKSKDNSNNLTNLILEISKDKSNKKDRKELSILQNFMLAKNKSQVLSDILHQRSFYYETNTNWIAQVTAILNMKDENVPRYVEDNLNEIVEISNQLEQSLGIQDCKYRQIVKSDLVSCISFVAIATNKIGNAKLEKFLNNIADQSDEEFKKKIIAKLANKTQYGDVELNWVQKGLLWIDERLRELHVLPTDPPPYRWVGELLDYGVTCTALKKAYELKYKTAKKAGDAKKMSKVLEALKRDIVFRQRAKLKYECLEKLLIKLRSEF